MNIRPLLLGLFFGTFLSSHADAESVKNFPFNVRYLSGDWVESYDDSAACAKSNLHIRMEISKDRKRFHVLLDRMWKNDMGTTSDNAWATILSATDRTLVIRYDNETRLRKSGEPVEWELSVVAPGVYRWRETSWPVGEVNTIVGLRCSAS